MSEKTMAYIGVLVFAVGIAAVISIPTIVRYKKKRVKPASTKSKGVIFRSYDGIEYTIYQNAQGVILLNKDSI